MLTLLSTGDTQEKICLALIQQARRGNIKAFEVSGTAYDRAVDELHAAEKYIADGNVGFARDELKYAHAWIEQTQREARTDAEKNKVCDLIAWHRLLQQKL